MAYVPPGRRCAAGAASPNRSGFEHSANAAVRTTTAAAAAGTPATVAAAHTAGSPDRSGFGQRSADAAVRTAAAAAAGTPATAAAAADTGAPAAAGSSDRSCFGRRSADAGGSPDRSGFGLRSADAEGPPDRSCFGQCHADAAPARFCFGRKTAVRTAAGSMAWKRSGARGNAGSMAWKRSGARGNAGVSSARSVKQAGFRVLLHGDVSGLRIPADWSEVVRRPAEWRSARSEGDAAEFNAALVRCSEPSSDVVKSVREFVGPACLVVVWSPEAERDPLLLDRLFFGPIDLSVVTGDAGDAVRAVHEEMLRWVERRDRKLSSMSRCFVCDQKEATHCSASTGGGLFGHMLAHHMGSCSAFDAGVCRACKVPTRHKHLMLHTYLAHSGLKLGYQRTERSAFVIVLQEDHVLMVLETGRRGWFVPAGGVESDETAEECAVRETREEADVRVRLVRQLRSDEKRTVFLAVPVERSWKVKTLPDWHSTRAAWVHVDAVPQLTTQNWDDDCDIPSLIAEARRHYAATADAPAAVGGDADGPAAVSGDADAPAAVGGDVTDDVC